ARGVSPRTMRSSRKAPEKSVALRPPARSRVLQPHLFERRHDVPGHDQIPVPLLVRRHDVPRRTAGVAAMDGVLIGRHVVVPPFTVLPVDRVELPGAPGILEALLQPFLLLA